jgi:hypothetical protein
VFVSWLELHSKFETPMKAEIEDAEEALVAE